MKRFWTSLGLVAALSLLAADFRFNTFRTNGSVTFSGAFTNGIVTVQIVTNLNGSPIPWQSEQNLFTTNTVADTRLSASNQTTFYRAIAVDLSGGRVGFTNLIESFSTLTTIAGAGGATGAGVNKWQAAFENAPATNALLSRPHIAMGDEAGNIFIADKDAHGVRKIRLDGTIVTVAGTSALGNGPDTSTLGTLVALNEPNGLWVRGDGTVYVLDLQNGKVRRLGTNGMMTTLFAVPGGISSGRGLWVKDDESLAYVCSGTIVKRWTPGSGVVNFSIGFNQLGNLAFDPAGALVVTDRGRHGVYRLSASGVATRIAGNESTVNSPGGGDGGLATLTALNQVRAICFLPTGAYFVGTDAGSQIWYVDVEGRIHLFLNGEGHAGDGTYFYNPAELRVSKVRQITSTSSGDLLITEHDAGYVRKVRFLRYAGAGMD